MRIGIARAITAIAVLASLAGAASAQNRSDAHLLSRGASFYAASERFGYYGTVAVYDTLKDAQHEKHARFSKQICPQRDGSLFVVAHAPAYYSDSADFLTNWYDDGAGNGGIGNPNNTDYGFIQIFDGLQGAPTTIKKEIGYWNRGYDTFTVELEGQNAIYPDNFARLWNAGYPDVGGEGTKGVFITYRYSLSAFGLSAVNQGNDFYTNVNNPSNYSGSFDAIFLNQSATSPESNGYYVVHLWFNNTSWAASDGYALNDEFGSNVVRNKDHED